MLVLASCQQLLGVDAYTVDSNAPPRALCDDCESSSDKATNVCTARSACSLPLPKTCPIVHGAPDDARSLRLGAVFDLSGPEAETGALLARSAGLAIAELNAAGGVLLHTESTRRPLTLIVCDLTDGPREVASMLVDKLKVRAMIGPSSQSAFRTIANTVAIPGGVLLLSPSALAEEDNADLAWAMVPSEAERVPMLLAQLRALESLLRDRRHAETLKLALITRADSAMTSLRLSQAQLDQEIRTLGAGSRRELMVYEYTAQGSALSDIVSSLSARQPDIVIADGGSEIVNELIAPLEFSLSLTAAPQRPHYLLAESSQGAQLLGWVASEPALQARVSILGAVPSQAAVVVHQIYERNYMNRFREDARGIVCTAAAYDSVYALAYALAAAEQPLVKPTTLADGLRQLSGGALALSSGPDDVDQVLEAIKSMQPMTLTGTLSEFSWSKQGSPRHGLVGTYCLGQADGRWRFISTGYSYDIATAAFAGHSRSCESMQGSPAQDGSQSAAARAPAKMRNAGSAPSASAMDGGTASASPSQADITTRTDAATPASDSPANRDGEANGIGPTPATDIGLAVQYQPLNTEPRDGVVGPGLKIINRSAIEQIMLGSLVVRYYFSNEHAELCPTECTIDEFYSGLQPSGVTVPAQRSYKCDQGSPDAYFELSFPGSDVVLGVGESVEAQQQFHTNSYRELDESNDYSFRAEPESYADWDHVTLLYEDVLVWGVPPGASASIR